MCMTKSHPCLTVLFPGPLTTVQDLGRVGYQRFGIAESGSMDTLSAVLANRLLDNPDTAAVLEITLIGPRLRFLAPTWCSLTGADISPRLDGTPFETGASFLAHEGQVLSFGQRRKGLRTYLAIRGGFDVPPILGSRSTYLYAGFGGNEGRALAKGDVLAAPDQDGTLPCTCYRLPAAFHLPEDGPREIRVVMGPHEDRFTAEGLQRFQSGTYEVTPDSNRMGYRLDGPRIEHLDSPIVVSEATPMGAVQIPGEGKPVILLRERGTTGGYTKIACVIRRDVDLLAQMPPGGRLRFVPVTVDEAHELERRRWQAVNQWKTPRP
jgi:antagonist of KipI